MLQGRLDDVTGRRMHGRCLSWDVAVSRFAYRQCKFGDNRQPERADPQTAGAGVSYYGVWGARSKFERTVRHEGGGIVTTSRKLEDIASQLDDMSVTVDEIKDEIKSTDALDVGKIDKVQAALEKASDMIDESLTPDPSNTRKP
jgi:hypothetical protein